MKLLALLALFALTSPAYASEEEIHPWKTMAVTADTQLHGPVEVKVGAGPKGNVATIAVTSRGKTITVPANWIETLPALRIESLQVRSEVGHDPQPWLYAVFKVGTTSDEVLFAIQGGKLVHATIKTRDAQGQFKWDVRKAP